LAASLRTRRVRSLASREYPASNTIQGEHHESSQPAESIYNHGIGLRIIAGQRDCPTEISKGPDRWFVDAGPGDRHTPRRH